MKVLIVCSINSGRIAPFIVEQVNSLSNHGVVFEYFTIKGSGFLGYLKNLKSLRSKVKTEDFDFIHAHYGLSGLLANLQQTIPVITTYHGSDVHFLFNRILSFITSRLSVFNIVTNTKQIRQLGLKKNFASIPCGIDTNLFKPMNKVECRKNLGFKVDDKLILFSSSFSREVKNAKLAQEAVNKFNDVSLIELKGYSRMEVAKVINAADAILITSFYETGPLIAKEALACEVPVVSTDVGDVAEIFGSKAKEYIVPYDAKVIAEKLKHLNQAHDFRQLVIKYDLANISGQILKVYKSIK